MEKSMLIISRKKSKIKAEHGRGREKSCAGEVYAYKGKKCHEK